MAEVCPFCQTPRPAEQRLPAPDMPLWTLPTATAPAGRPLLLGQLMILADGRGRLYGVRTSDGRLAWQYDCGGRLRSPLAAHGKRLYLALRERDILALELPAEPAEGQPVASPWI